MYISSYSSRCWYSYVPSTQKSRIHIQLHPVAISKFDPAYVANVYMCIYIHTIYIYTHIDLCRHNTKYMMRSTYYILLHTHIPHFNIHMMNIHVDLNIYIYINPFTTSTHGHMCTWWFMSVYIRVKRLQESDDEEDEEKALRNGRGDGKNGDIAWILGDFLDPKLNLPPATERLERIEMCGAFFCQSCWDSKKSCWGKKHPSNFWSFAVSFKTSAGTPMAGWQKAKFGRKLLDTTFPNRYVTHQVIH